MAPLASVLLAATVLSANAVAQITTEQIVGTWSTKTQRVLTGPGFYNPSTETLIEPSLTGISYSFTSDGFYEEAYFRAIANPTDPSCPQAVLQWQHGSYVLNADSSMTLTPIAVDGRQLYSDPCVSSTTTMMRYDQTEAFTKTEVLTDTFNQQLRLNIFGYNGQPMNPMWLNSTTPIMLPTTTLTPQATQAAKRSLRGVYGGTTEAILGQPRKVVETAIGPLKKIPHSIAGRIFWLGLSLTAIGSILVFYG